MRTRMKRFGLGAALICAGFGMASIAQAANNYPVIFVHGFAGFGPAEMLGYKYWGGLTDLQSQLQAKYTNQVVKTAVVGPFSSNWDHAVELFYQIKGGCVDYGEMHAQTYGHLRKPEAYYHNGRTCYLGLYPAWDASHPVHLVSHSMGGQTSRMLVQLLKDNGAPTNPGLFPSSYTTSSNWVKSVTTISTPNDGTTLAYRVMDWVPFVQQLVTGIAGIAGVTGNPATKIYDFKMDQWKIGPQTSSEGFTDYVSRVMNSPLWSNSQLKDISTYDLSPAGAMEENHWVKDQPNVYYFSVSTKSSTTGLITGWEYPIASANPLLGILAGPGWMGNFTPDSRPFPYSASNPAYKSWWATDTVVPTVSMKAPTWAMDERGVIYARSVTIKDISNSGAPQVGAWNWKGLMDTWDHMDIIGWSLFWDSVGWYKKHVDQLRSL